jgi:hypothetical protein
MVAIASFCTASITCQMVRFRSSLSLNVSIIDAALACGIW